MRKITIVAMTCFVTAGLAAQSPAPGGAPPPWVYTVNPPPTPGATPAPVDPAPKQLPGATVSFTVAQTRDANNPPDWHPEGHPAMPDAVAHGRKGELRACGFCHLTNGQGRPENAGLAGLPAAYITQQMADFKSGNRKSAEPKMGPPAAMLQDAKAATDADIAAAAAYFSSFPFKKWIRVVEAKDVPKSKIAGSMHVPTNDGTEPLGQRIIELPENLERTELRDGSSSFVAYVPVGSIAKGEALVKTGGAGKTVACGTCHGPDLRGLGPVPPLAGRSPSYTIRQLYDLQTGVRKGTWSALMKGAVEKLTIDDMINIAAYTSSREPEGVQPVQYKSPAGVEYRSQPDTDAIRAARAAVAANPKDIAKIIDLGVAQSGARQFREAIATFSKGLEIEPNNALLLRWRGHRYLSVREFDKAIADLKRGSTLDPTIYGIWYHLGVLQFLKGEFADAAASFAKAQPIAPDAGELAGSTDWLWMSLSRAGRGAEAKAMLDRRPDNKPVDNAYTRRLKLYRGEIGPDAVVTAADTDDVQIATLAYGLGNWYLVKGDKANAKKWFERSVQSGGWPGFGFIVSEVELQRMR